MAKLKIKKIEIAAAVSESDKIIRLLQRRGFVELSEPEELENTEKNDTSYMLDELEKKSRVCVSALDILKRHTKKSGGMLSSLSGRKAVSDDEFDKLSSQENEIYAKAVEVTNGQNSISEAKISIIRLKTRIDALKPWLELDIPMNFKGTQKTSALIGSIPKKVSEEDILSELASNAPDIECIEVKTVSRRDDQTCAAVFCLKSEKAEVERVLRGVGFSEISEPAGSTAKEETEKLENEISSLEKGIDESLKRIGELSEWYDKIEFLIDKYSIEKDKYEALGSVVHSEKLLLISGFVPEYKSEKLKKDIEEKFCAAVIISEPNEDTDVPVMLKNNGFASPVETITEMYSMPGKNDVDPTPIMAFFYYFFFGMMLSDAGYGLIIALVTGFIILKFKPEQKLKNTLKMYCFCGISTVFWGAMYGSWFGDMPNIIGSNFFNTDKFASTAIWIDPLKELMNLLVYCFIFGLVHLFTGVGIKAFNLWKHGRRFEAFCESVPTAVAIFGFCPIFFGLFTEVPDWLRAVGTPALIIGVILVILTAGRGSKSIVGKLGGGLYGLYNLVSGYLGDVLSYARLLALGLSTGVIAQVVNMLCTLPSSNVLKIIMLIVVGTVGHIANLGINLIGAYVHTNRLQYVEFFSKFYEGGGRAMRPLRINTKNYKFKEEI